MKLIILALGFVFFGLSAQENESASVGFLIGKVSVKGTSESKWRLLKKDDKIENGDTIMTGNGSTGTIFYKGSEVKVLPNSTLLIKRLYTKEKDADVEVKQGIVWYKLVNLNGKRFNSNSPTSSAGVRGTAFATVYDEKAKTDLTCVCEGKVEVTPFITGGKSVLVEKGNGVSLKSNETKITPISYKGEMAKGESFPGFEKKIKTYPILKNCLSCHTPNGWKADGFLKDEKYGK